MPTAGEHNLEKMRLIGVPSRRAIAPVWRKQMKRLAIAALIVATPAFALDGTRSPANVPPIIGIAPGNSPDAVRQFQRGAADLLVQANPGATSSLKDQLVGA